MKRSSSTYRLQMIKEVALRKQQIQSDDPMANYIHHLLNEQPLHDKSTDYHHSFTGNHFDERIGGWISDRWSLNK
ncbi:hypothetical protein [Vibrio mangrovi]|uniref:Uncharacterized protein n=1 Tax=Vibrio mangrovi TaxID=474394 RepID=A0A1Y6ITG9_9VIBR|nr:hypothetical protein [Vibrio mangrovi]MDW6003842.1 hypothetical protein [Vibrio mangrovi]SMR99363.1 hypothetical protein VIM7927_00588 [Vibrio mangrovi]